MADLGSVFAHIDAHFEEYLEEIRRFLRQPGYSHTGEGMPESAAMALDYIRGLGSDGCRFIRTDGYPVATGILRSRRPNAKTLIVYSFYDEVPVIPADWTFPPHEGRIVDASSLGLPAYVGQVMCGRATANQRGPMMACLLAIRSLLAVDGDVPANLLWVWEGEDEIQSPHLPQYIEQAYDELARADGWWCPGFRQDERGRFVDVRGFKGTLKVELVCKGGDWGGTRNAKDLWSANLPWVDAPYWRIIRALNSLVDTDDRIVIDGFWDHIRPVTPEERRELDDVRARFDENEMRESLGIARFRGGRAGVDLLERFIMDPMLNVVGIVGGYTGPGIFTTLPMQVAAKIDIRFPPNIRSTEIMQLLRAHLDRRGFREMEIRRVGGYEWSRTAPDDPLMVAAAGAAARHGFDYFRWPTHAAVNTCSLFNQPPLRLPVSFAGAGHGGRWHQPDEYCTVQGLKDAMKYTVTFLREWASLAGAV
jgi:acetylornithine deacetylase/succinyl-diaminopimelate desuccinylase-like protein